MARNRKNQPAAVRFGPAVKAMILCVFIGGAGIGYVWQKNQIYALGQQIKEHELKLQEMRRQNKLRNDHLAYLRSPRVLDARVKELNLGLIQPQPAQILRLTEWPAEAPLAPGQRYAGRADEAAASQ